MRQTAGKDTGASKRQAGARTLITAIAVVALAIVIAAGARLATSRPQNVSDSPNAVESTAERKAAPDFDFQKLKGRWIRPDGGYIIEIRDVDESGNVHAAYYNPRSINVARAQASREGDAITFYLELRDINYPGSYYALTYDPRTDRLSGSYYQAVVGETYAIFFERGD